MTTWQPIETAPKDGTRILVYYPSGFRNQGAKTGPRDPGFAVCSWYEHTAPGEWQVEVESYEETWLPAEPTHWMPIPKGPDEVLRFNYCEVWPPLEPGETFEDRMKKNIALLGD